jgi:signal transduction histidine kinase
MEILSAKVLTMILSIGAFSALLSYLSFQKGLSRARGKNVSTGENMESHLCRADKMAALGRLAGCLAHDLNNILGAIEGYSTLILKDLPPGDPLRPDIEEIHKAEQRAAALTKQLVIFSRAPGVQKTTVDLNKLISGLEKTVKSVIGETITLEISAAPDLRPVRADAGQLEQMFINLLMNSRDAMPGGGAVKITTANTDFSDSTRRSPQPVGMERQFVKITVGDSGSGMNSATLDRLFEPFFTTKTKGNGKGLGLSAVYGIVNQHNGWITAHSEEGKGSLFTIYLPQASAAAAK